MLNRYVIALNHHKIGETKTSRLVEKEKISLEEVNKLMNYVRKYPIDKIDTAKLFTCGFSMN